jgi:hypothetical protein
VRSEGLARLEPESGESPLPRNFGDEQLEIRKPRPNLGGAPGAAPAVWNGRIPRMARTIARRAWLSLAALTFFVALGAGSLGSPTRAVADEESFEAAAGPVKKQFDSKIPNERLLAFHRLGKIRDPRAFDLVLVGFEKERARAAVIAKAQADTETALEASINDMEKLKGEPPPSTEMAIDSYNARSRKIQKKCDDLTDKQRNLSVDAVQQKAVLGGAVAALVGVVELLPRVVSTPLIDRLTAEWNGPKSTLADRLRWVDVLGAVHVVPVGEALQKLALDTTAEVHLRGAALAARAVRLDAGAIDDCIAVLVEGPDHLPVVAAAIESLRRLHKQPGIEPLITFLGRNDIGRLREDAHRALRSLTGQKHGPYKQPWADWWKDSMATFVMPEKPSDALELAKPDKGVTFFSVTTFSEHLLFVLDVSGSMLDAAHPNAAGARSEERKIDLLRKELLAALAMLDESKTFDIIFFSHRVFRLFGVMTPASKATVERARKFVMDLEPTGATNIFDALETAFRVSGVATATTTGKDVASVDTIFFMTDGKPTAGKQMDPDRILDAVTDWNHSARLTIHAIGLGDECDLKFLEALAIQNGGQFVKR